MLLASLSLSVAAPAGAAPCVILIHGLGRTPASMAPFGRDLTAKGYVVVSLPYRSTSPTIEASTAVVGRDIDQCRGLSASPINFVTHSMGAILLRLYFQDHRLADAGRVVMLAPPNHGSEVVDRHGGQWWYRMATGPAGLELKTGPGSLANSLRPIPLQIGVIAGTRSHEPWFAGDFHGPNDGKVSVDSAKLSGMTDFITVDASHTFIMNSRSVQDQTVRFIATGHFSR